MSIRTTATATATWLGCGLGLVSLGLVACRPAGSSSVPTPAPTVNDTDTTSPSPEADRFASLRDEILVRWAAMLPARAVESGQHDHDGEVRATDAAGLARDLEQLRRDVAALEAIDVTALDRLARVEHGTLTVALRGEIFELSVRRAPWRNPMFYLGDLNLTPYIARDYAPLAQRAEAIIAIANATPAHLQHAAENLEANLPRPWIDTALLQVRGTIEFVERDVPTAMKGLPDEVAQQLQTALGKMKAALVGYDGALLHRQKTATDDYALGAETFVAMLRETQGIDVDLERLREIGQADLERNLAAMEKVAKSIDPKASVRKTVLKIQADKPAADEVLEVATDQATSMRRFLVDHHIVTIPTDDVAVVTESPPFMRWNAAFLDPAGPFETGSLPSFYYISPPDPAWPKKQQRAYIPGTTDLLFITIHEVWPGHFLHNLHVKAQPSRVLKTFWNYATGEGWAHYTEEMMWDAGLSEDPAVHVGQLQNALLRNVRYMAAIGLHEKTMTVAQAEALFREQAFQDQANARQQAVRGTFDPMFLAYTLGKLAIVQLRRDVEAREKAAGRAFSQQAFHDELLSYGAAPLPVIRAAMLGPDAGPLL